ncbi:hypothetical protein GCM10028833_16600 [Glycomyces tarimensis]
MGSGGHGEVWRAVDPQLDDRPVALKRALHGGDAGAPGRIRREAGTLASVNHPNVVTVYDAVEDDGDWWIVMEYVPGRSLADLGTIPPAEAARYGAQLAGGLEAVHAIGVMHRDIKPANILVTDQGFAKLADFGISRNVHAVATLTGTGAVTGTPGYVAPEVVRGGRFTAASDVFSLGATLYAAMEGASPFGEDNAHALLWRTATEEVDEPKRAGAMTPVLMRLLDKDPRRRPTPGQARKSFAELCGEPDIGAGPRPRRPHSRALAAAVAALAFLAAGIWAALGEDRDRPDDPVQGRESVLTTDFVGDPATADPCALLDAEALAAFGEAKLDTDEGEFNSCDVFVDVPDASEVDVELEIYRSTTQPPDGEAEVVGQIGVVRSDEDMPEECDRTLILPDGEHIVSIDAEQMWGGSVDLCAMADTAVDGALAVLEEGPIPRREGEPDPGSLIGLSACELLDDAALERFPGVDANHPVVSFAEWDCRWNSTTSDDFLRVLFQRSEPLVAGEEGEPVELAGREAFVQGDRWAEGSCLVSVVNRQEPSVDGDGTITAELVRVYIEGDEPIDELCDMAIDFAEPIAAALPSA